MITKDQAMHIYNLHSQIEKSNEIINVLAKCKDEYEKNNQGVEIIKDGWKEYSATSAERIPSSRNIQPFR